MVAIDPLTSIPKWEYKVVTPPRGGIMATAGGTVEGLVFAVEARTGNGCGTREQRMANSTSPWQ